MFIIAGECRSPSLVPYLDRMACPTLPSGLTGTRNSVYGFSTGNCGSKLSSPFIHWSIRLLLPLWTGFPLITYRPKSSGKESYFDVLMVFDGKVSSTPQITLLRDREE